MRHFWRTLLVLLDDLLVVMREFLRNCCATETGIGVRKTWRGQSNGT